MATCSKPRDPDSGRRMDHYEWNGWLYCHDEQKAFDFTTAETTCPHCGDKVNTDDPAT